MTAMRPHARTSRLAAALLAAALLAAGALAPAHRLLAQGDHAPVLTVGAASGSLTLGDGTTSSGGTLLVVVSPRPWISVSASPMFERVSDKGATTGTTITSGIGDTPVGVDLHHALGHGRLAPSIFGGIGGTLPTGDASKGLGVDKASASASVGASLSPLPRLTFSGGVGRDLASTTAGDPTATFVDGGVDLSLTNHLGLSVGVSGDVAGLDTASGYHSVGAGLAYDLPAGWTVGASWSRGGVAGQVMQGFSVGVGTTLASFVPSSGSPLSGGLKLVGLGRQSAKRVRTKLAKGGSKKSGV